MDSWVDVDFESGAPACGRQVCQFRHFGCYLVCLQVEFIPTKSRFLGTRSGPLRLSRCGKKIPRKTPNFKQDIHFAFGYFVGGAGELIRYDDRVSNA
jgi:hypothetical protein